MGRVSFLPSQLGEGTPSLENVRPIVPGLVIDGIGDIYGGYVDFDAGEVVEEWSKRVLNGSESWDINFDRFRYVGLRINYNKSDPMADIYKYAFPIYGTTAYGRFGTNAKGNAYAHFTPPDDSIGRNDVTAWKAWLVENPVTVVYPLESSVSHTLTSSQLTQAYNQLVKVSPVMLDRRRRIIMSSPHLTSASGQLATFQTDLSAPLKEMKVHFYPVQASGTPSPDNVLPISGWDGVTVTRCGKNLAPLLSNTDFWSMAAWFDSNGIIHNSGNYKMCDYKIVSPGKEYVLSTTNTGWKGIGFYDELYNPLKFNQRAAFSIKLTCPDNAKYYRVYLFYNAINIQFEEGSEPTDYEPYTAQSIPITFPQTIYGGYVDLVKGEVVEEYGSDGQPITPQAYPLTPQTIKTLKGINNIFSDANGNVDVTYWTH